MTTTRFGGTLKVVRVESVTNGLSEMVRVTAEDERVHDASRLEWSMMARTAPRVGDPVQILAALEPEPLT